MIFLYLLRSNLSVVYVPMGLGVFLLHQVESIDAHHERRIVKECPQCEQQVIMTGMGFTECIWDAWGNVVGLCTRRHIVTSLCLVCDSLQKAVMLTRSASNGAKSNQRTSFRWGIKC